VLTSPRLAFQSNGAVIRAPGESVWPPVQESSREDSRQRTDSSWRHSAQQAFAPQRPCWGSAAGSRRDATPSSGGSHRHRPHGSAPLLRLLGAMRSASGIHTRDPRVAARGSVGLTGRKIDWDLTTQGREHQTPSPRSPAAHQLPRPPANTKPSTSGGPVTSGFAWPSPPWPTTADTPAPGPRRSTTTPAQPAKTTPSPSHPRSCRDPSDLTLLAQQHALRPHQATEPPTPSLHNPRSTSRHEVDTGSVMPRRPSGRTGTSP
jgi:hypothetical protein